MESDAVKSLLAKRADDLRAALTKRWGDVPHRIRDPIRIPKCEFPATPDDIFPWVAVCFVVDDGQILLVQDSKHSSAWEPPGGKGEVPHAVEFAHGGCRERKERPVETAERETREETGIHCEVTELLFTETLRFDYGDSVLAPVLQAGFVARRVGGDMQITEDAIEDVAWFPLAELPEGTQFREDIELLSDW